MKRLILVALIIGPLFSLLTFSKSKKVQKVTIEIEEATFAQGELDSLAYAYGVMFGNQYSNFQDSGVVVPEKIMNLDNFLAGFVRAMRRDSSNLKISVDDAEVVLRSFQEKMMQEMEEKRQAELKETKAKNAEYLAENAKKEGVLVTESGLQIQTVVEGTGEQPQDDDNVLINYKGSLIDGTVFDANDSIELNVSRVIPGFSEGIKSMKEGGISILTIPSDLAYGDRGAGEDIPAGATLIFEIKLLKIEKEQE